MSGPFDYETAIDMTNSYSEITIENLDVGARYKVSYAIMLYEGKDVDL